MTEQQKVTGKLALAAAGAIHQANRMKLLSTKNLEGTPDTKGKKQKRNAPCCCGSRYKAKDCCVYFPDGMGGVG